MSENDRILARYAYFQRRLGMAIAHAAGLCENGRNLELFSLGHHVFHNLLGSGSDTAGSHSHFNLHKRLGILCFLADIQTRLKLFSHCFEVS